MEKNTPCYYRITAYTPYCGEEISTAVSVSSDDELYKLAGEFTDDCANESIYEHTRYWQEDGYNTKEEAEKDFYSGCFFEIEEISEEEQDSKITLLKCPYCKEPMRLTAGNSGFSYWECYNCNKSFEYNIQTETFCDEKDFI